MLGDLVKLGQTLNCPKQCCNFQTAHMLSLMLIWAYTFALHLTGTLSYMPC